MIKQALNDPWEKLKNTTELLFCDVSYRNFVARLHSKLNFNRLP
jgi:hypothetical protein